MSVKGPFIESELAHCHDPVTATPSRSVTVAVKVVPIWGCNEEMSTLPSSLTLVTVIVRSEFAQVIPVIVVGPGHAVFAAGAEPHRYPVDVVTFDRGRSSGVAPPSVGFS